MRVDRLQITQFLRKNTFILIFAIIISIPVLLAGAIVQLGSGSYTTDLPPGGNPPQYNNGATAYPAVTGNVTGPTPTNDWWTSLVYKNNVGNNFSEVLAAHPFMLKCTSQGLGIGVTGSPVGSYSYPYTEELVVGVGGVTFPEALLDGYGDWTIDTMWEIGVNSLSATFGHGLSYVYFTKTGGNAYLDFIGSPSVWYNSNGVLGVTINGHHYGIFAPTGSSWSITGDILQSGLNGNDYFSIAALPDNSTATLNYFKTHAYAFITDSQVSWNYDENNSLLTTAYQVTTQIKEGSENESLLALYRHQWLNSSEVFTSYTYPSPRGTMKLFEGNSFDTEMTFMGVMPGFPDELSGSGGYSQSQLQGYIQDLTNQSIDQLIPWGDTYFHGKDLGKIAQVVRIAEQVGNTTARDYFISCLKSRLENWLTASAGESSPLYYYNNTWGTLVGFPASFASDSQLNDHHFHWAYFIMAAATIAQYDATWASGTSWGEMVEMLIRDAAAWDRNDTLFPFLRSYDIYAGHGWAGGHGSTADGNNQESSSESLNFAAAVALWGSATGDNTIRDLGIYLYTNEYTAVEQYWFDVDNEVFPSWFNHNCVGIVWGTGGVHSTWFSGDPEMIHGINFLPITSASLYLGRHPDYVMDNYNEIVAENGGAEDVWYDVIWEYLALSDPDLALSKFNNYPTYPEEGGETRAHTYYWLHSLKSMGQVDLTVTADVPNYAVFLNNGVRTYTAYNPTFSPITVNFSDGETLDVSARELTSSTAGTGSYDEPQVAADTPAHDEITNSVISIYSDEYTNISGIDYNPAWGQTTTVTVDENVAGDNTLLYENLNFQGTDWNGNPQNVSDLEFLHIDFWTANSTDLGIYIVSGVFPTHSEAEYEFSITQQQWNSVDIPLTHFSNSGVSLNDVRQFKVEGTGDIWLDNLYFWKTETSLNDDAILSDLLVDGATVGGFSSTVYTYDAELPEGTTIVPTVTAVTNDVNANYTVTDAASLPGTTEVEVTAEDAVTILTYNINFTLETPNSPSGAPIPSHNETTNGIVSIYSDSYTDITGVDYNPAWGQVTQVTYEVLDGNNALKYSNLNFQGTDWNANPQNISNLEYLHVDFWTATSTELGIYLISGVFPTHTEIEYVFDITTHQWNSVDILLSYFSDGGVNLSDARQFKVEGTGDVWLDNLYFYADEAAPTEPVTAAPNPQEAAENVISLFSNVYTDVFVDTWSATWDQADVSDIQIAGNDTKLYTNLNYAGIEFTTQTIDASSMTYFHLDVWTADDTSSPNLFKVKLVDFGTDGVFGGGNDVEHEITFDENTMQTGAWVSLNIPMVDFTNLVTKEHLTQLIVSGDPNTVYVDNIYFYSEITQLDAPENVMISVMENDVTVSWAAVTGANSYKIYSSDFPNGTQRNWTLEAESITQTNWTETVFDIKKFYYVVASSARNNLIANIEEKN